MMENSDCLITANLSTPWRLSSGSLKTKSVLLPMSWCQSSLRFGEVWGKEVVSMKCLFFVIIIPNKWPLFSNQYHFPWHTFIRSSDPSCARKAPTPLMGFLLECYSLGLVLKTMLKKSLNLNLKSNVE